MRACAIIVLLALLVRTMLARRHGPEESADIVSLGAQLERWSTKMSPSQVNVTLSRPPDGKERDWLSGLGGAGTRVTWYGPTLLATAVVAEPRADPQGGLNVNIAAPDRALVQVGDSLGVLGTFRMGTAGLRVHLAKNRATVDAVVGPVDARAAVLDSLELKRLFLVGAAGWEAKFALIALEERGWKADAEIALSPKGDVAQGRLTPLDTARYSAVLALDSTAARYGERIARYVRAGGGLVLWAPAARVRALASIAPGPPGQGIADQNGPPPDSAPRSALELVPINALVPDAAVLERRASMAAVAVRRVGLGRVVETGYTDLWRWRMAGGAAAPARERDWLSGLVSLVAHAPRYAVAAAPSDAAPFASLVDRLGAPSSTPLRAMIPAGVLARWMFAVLCGALFAEWASRRLRGVK